MELRGSLHIEVGPVVQRQSLIRVSGENAKLEPWSSSITAPIAGERGEILLEVGAVKRFYSTAIAVKIRREF